MGQASRSQNVSFSDLGARGTTDLVLAMVIKMTLSRMKSVPSTCAGRGLTGEEISQEHSHHGINLGVGADFGRRLAMNQPIIGSKTMLPERVPRPSEQAILPYNQAAPMCSGAGPMCTLYVFGALSVTLSPPMPMIDAIENP